MTLCLTASTFQRTRASPCGTLSIAATAFLSSLGRNLSRTPSFAIQPEDNFEGVGLGDIGKSEEQDKDTMEDNKSWRTLIGASSAKTRNIRGSNYVQIATIDPETNEPRCRTVVFRGFLNLPDGHEYARRCDDLSCVMRMITDVRSQKVEQVMKNPSKVAELLWWFPKTSEQYRINGQLIFVGGGQFEYDGDKALASARKEMWGNLSDFAREQFFTEKVPGEPYGGPWEVPTGGRDDDGKLLPIPDNFLLMLLVPKHCDYLRLGNNMYRQIDRLVDGEWKAERVNP